MGIPARVRTARRWTAVPAPPRGLPTGHSRAATLDAISPARPAAPGASGGLLAPFARVGRADRLRPWLQVGGQLIGIYTACLQVEPDRVGPTGDEAERGQLPAAAAAQLRAERIAGILQHAVQQVLRPIPASPRSAANRAASSIARLASR